MRKLSNPALIGANQLDTNQGDIIAHVVNEILCRLVLRLGWQLIVVHLAAVLPVHPKNVALPHNRERCLTCIRRRKRRITPASHGRVLIAFPAVFIIVCAIMTSKTFPAKAAFVIANPKSKLLDQMREVLRTKHYSLRTEEAYVQWARRFLKFHRDQAGAWRHPRELGATEIVAFLNHLANAEHVAAATQNQALNAIAFLYSQVLGRELGDLGEFLRASKPRRVPVVLSQGEVGRLMASLEGTWRLMAQLLYGTGLRLMEGLRLRVRVKGFASRGC